jgi:hypothetical protein
MAGNRPTALLPGLRLIVPVKYQIGHRYAYEFIETCLKHAIPRAGPFGRPFAGPLEGWACAQWFAIGIFVVMESALANEYTRICRDPATHQPLAYLRLRRAIRNVVEHRDIEPGQALPSERDLSQALKLSRVTVRKAIAGLVEEVC